MKLLKRTKALALAAALALTMLMPAGVYAGNAEIRDENPAERTEGKNEAASEEKEEKEEMLRQIVLSVGDGQDTPVFAAGEKTTLTIRVLNKGNTDAKHVRIAPVVTSAELWPFDLDKLNYQLDLGEIKAGQQASAVWGTEKEPLTVRGDVTGKSYQLRFQITYDDGAEAYESEKHVFVKTKAAQKPAGEAGTEKPGSGTGTGAGTGASGGTGSGSQTSGGSASAGEGSGSAGGSGGADLSGGGFSNSDPVVSGGGGTEKASVPRVIVTGFSTEPGEVRAGTDFKLIVHVKNTSKRTAVSNLLFDFQAPAAGSDAAAEAPAFLPVSGSSSVYLDHIPADGTKDISIALNARADLVQKPYSVAMSMQYEDGDSVQYEGSSSLAIPVKQEARYEFSKIQISPDSVEVGEEANITCSLYNLGRVKMYNVKVRFESSVIEGQEQFIGNLDPGSSGMIDAIVTATEESYDESNCRLILTYEDDTGKETAVEQTFTIQITPMEETAGKDMGEELPEESGGSPLPVILGILTALGAAAAAAVILIRRRKKKSQTGEEEEWIDEMDRLAEDERRQS